MPVDDIAEAAGSTILVVEDDDDLRSVTSMMLSDFGHRVLEARTGPDALALLCAVPQVDLVLSDVVLPDGMNGPEMVRVARRSHGLLKAIYMSGYAGDAPGFRGELDDGAVLLQKPFEQTELRRRVHEALAET